MYNIDMHTHTQVMQSSQGNSCYNVHMNMDDASGFYHSCWLYCFVCKVNAVSTSNMVRTIMSTICRGIASYGYILFGQGELVFRYDKSA